MSIWVSLLIVAAFAAVGNRILSIGAGVWLRVPLAWMFTVVYSIDLVQIPMFFWLYERGSRLLEKLPFRVPAWITGKPGAEHPIGGWLASLGGLGVMFVAALPTFGGGMWSAVYLADRLPLSKRQGVVWLALGSLLSFVLLYWIISAGFGAIRYFSSLSL